MSFKTQILKICNEDIHFKCFFTFMINFMSPIFHATPIGKFNMMCATPSFEWDDKLQTNKGQP